MNLISQNCLTGLLYRDHFRTEFPNPFIWTVIDFKSMLSLIQNWDKLNFDKFMIAKDNKWNFSIIIDSQIKVQYVHYKFDPAAKIPMSDGVDTKYCRIWEFIVKKYIERLKRMQKLKESPIFCICNFKTIFPEAIYSKEQLDQLRRFKNVKILTGCENLNPSVAAGVFYKKLIDKSI